MSEILKFDTSLDSTTVSNFEIYKLVDFYDQVLRIPTITVDLSTTAAKKHADKIANSLAETLRKYEGIGLSANQCGRTERMFAMHMGEDIVVFINPEIIEKSQVTADYPEGCLSYPGLYLNVKRPNYVIVKFQALGGEWIEQRFDGLTAVCIQHEIDHLDGIVYTNRVSSIKLEQAKRKVKRNIKKMNAYVSQLKKQEHKQIVSEKQKTKPIASDQAPVIKILESTNFSKKEPEKFIYGA